MIILNPADCRSLFRKLDIKTQEFFLSEYLGEQISNIAKSYNLDEDEEGQITLIAGYYLLGALQENLVTKELLERIDIDTTLADKLANEVLRVAKNLNFTENTAGEINDTTVQSTPLRLDLIQKERVAEGGDNKTSNIPAPIQVNESPSMPKPVVLSAPVSSGAVRIESKPSAQDAEIATDTKPAPAANTQLNQSPTTPTNTIKESLDSKPLPPTTPKPAPSPLAVDLSSLRATAASAIPPTAPNQTTQTQTPSPVFIREEGAVKPIQIEGHIPTPTQNAAFNSKDQISALGGSGLGMAVKEKAGPATVEFGGVIDSNIPPPLASAVLPPKPSGDIYEGVVSQAPKPTVRPADIFESGLSSIPAPVVRPLEISKPQRSFWSSFIESVSPIKKTKPPTPSAPPERFNTTPTPPATPPPQNLS